MARTVTLYRDDSTVQVVYSDVKHVFWTAANTVLVIARYNEHPGDPDHHYIHWPRERFCWFRDEPHAIRLDRASAIKKGKESEE